ncbi:hypothetical protein BC940DRAFT_367008 [Gongronella butleri]|nr:hypothetical protein BC940DRAFT_367008 [Gongronella butleri]
MTRLIHELPHTTFAWCPTTPVLATASETNDHHFQLDLFHLTTDINGTRQVPLGKAPTSSRVSTLAWGSYQATHTWGLLAAGTDHGGLELWDPWAMADTEKSPGRSALLHETSTHSRRILHMDFNSHQTNLLATAGNDNDVAIWDLSHGLERPYKAGFQTDSAMDSVTHLTWNSHVSHILGLARSSGRTAVLDLRARRQAFTLQGDHPIAAMAWNPDNATQLVTASSDDNYPHLMLWDLRHAQRPEKVLQSHTRSITDVSWCRQDSDVLVSSSKDGRIVSWHPRQGTATDIACTQEYALQVDFCPRNPNWLASWHLGEIFIWTIAHDHALGDDRDLAATPAPQDAIMPAATTPAPTKPPPKWLRRPVGASFGYGGKLVVFTHQRPSSDPRQAPHLPAATNSTGNPRVTLSTVQDAAIAKRIRHLETARVDRRALNGLINERCEQQPSSYDWAVLQCLFAASPRKALIEFLSSFDLTPLSRENTKSTLLNESRPLRQQDTMPSNAPLSGGGGGDNVLSPPMSPMHPENALDAPPPAIGAINRVDATPSPATSTLSGIFRSAAGQLDQHGQRSPLDDLFSTNDAPLPPQHVFGQRWMLPPELQQQQQQQQQHPQHHHQQPQQHHLAASTYPLIDTGNDEDDDENARVGKKGELTAPSRSLLLDRQISQAVAVGNLDLAVSLCLQDNERMADALLLAVSAGQEVFAKTRRAYLEKRAHVPSMQLLDSIVRQDLTSHVQNCHVDDWRSVLAVLCTYAPPTHFSPLCDLLGQRLETAARAYHETTTPLDANEDDPQQWLRQARVCYMVAGNVDRVLALWTADDEIGYKNASFDTMADREKHDLALVALMEMVVVLLIAFENKATSSSASNTMTMPVPGGNDLLFAKYEAYTRLLAREGHMDLAFQYVERITTPSKDVQWLHHRIYCAMEINAALIQPTRPVYPFDSASEITRAPATAITSSPMPSISTVSPIDPSQGATAYHHQHAHPHHQHEPFMTTIHPPTQLPTPLPDGFQPPYVQHPPPPPPPMQARRYHRLSRQISTDMLGAGGFLQAAATAQHQQHQQGRDTLHFDPIQHQLPSLYQEDFFFDSLSPSEQPTLSPIHAPPPPHMDPALAYRLSRLDGSVYHDSEDMEYFADADDDDQDIDTLDYASPAENPPFDASPPRPTPQAPSAMNQAFGKLTISPEQQYQQQQQQQQHRINRAPSKVYLQHPSQDHKTPQFNVDTSPPRPQYHHHQQMAAHEASPTADTQHKASPQREQGPTRFSPQQERSPARMGNEDRSRIRPDLLTIYHVLSQALPLSRHFMEPSQRKQWDDTAKKLSELFDALNARTVSEDVAQYLLQLAQALASARYDRALDLHMSLVTTKYQECGSWLLAVKRVIEYKRDLAQSFTP